MSVLERIIEPGSRLSEDRRIFSNTDLKNMIVPLLIEQILQMVVGIADTLMVSYAGEATVSGVSLDTMIYTIFIYIFTAVSTGGAVVVSQYLGRGERKHSDFAASQIFNIALISSVICLVLMLLGGNAVLDFLYPSVEPDVMAACRTYLWIVTLSFPANAVYNAGAAVYRSMGKTATTMKVSISMNILNVIGNAIGIFVLHAGAAGVAWPTTLSWYFAAVVMTALCFRRENEVSIRLPQILRTDRVMSGRILGIAIPNGVESGIFQAVKVALGAMIATFGTSQIAANGIGQTIWSLGAVISMSMSPVFITVIGRCVGAGDHDAADYYLHKLTRLTMLMAFVWCTLIVAAMPVILPIYDISAETRRLVFIIVVIHNIFAVLAQPFSTLYAAGLRAAGDVRYTMYANIVCTILVRVLLSYLLGVVFKWGIIGITVAMVMEWSIKGVVMVLRYRTGKWRHFRVI